MRWHSEELRKRLWNEMLAARMCEFYYARRAANKRAWGRTFGYVTAVFSSATVVTAIEQTTELLNWSDVNPIWPGLVATIAGVVVGTARFEKAAMDFGNHSIAWSALHHRLYDTWVEFESWRIDHDDVRAVLDHIHEQVQLLDRQVVTQRDNEKLAKRCFDKAEELARAA